MIYKSHGSKPNGTLNFRMDALLLAEVETFKALNCCVNFQDPFFVIVEVCIIAISTNYFKFLLYTLDWSYDINIDIVNQFLKYLINELRRTNLLIISAQFYTLIILL